MIGCKPLRRSFLCSFVFISQAAAAGELKVWAEADPLSRYEMIHYAVPPNAPDHGLISCRYRLEGGAWKPASVRKYRSWTAEMMAESATLVAEETSGRVEEFFCSDSERTLMWDVFQQLRESGVYKPQIEVQVSDEQGNLLAKGECGATIDLHDVVVPTEKMVVPPNAVAMHERSTPGWIWGENGLLISCNEQDGPLEPLCIRPKLKGYYAVYVSVPENPSSLAQVRISSDLYSQRFVSLDGRDRLWRIVKMDGEHLIVSQPASTLGGVNDANRARIRAIRFVPISEASVAEQLRLQALPRNKLVFAYYEPYSWAFHEWVDRNAMLLEPIAAYADAKVDLVSMQLGRLGARPVYPSQVDEPLLGPTHGDPSPGGEPPTSNSVGRLVRLTSPWPGSLRFANSFGLKLAANFGAGIAYPNSALESDWAKAHPEWVRDHLYPRYEIPEVRQHFLSLWRELLDQGARYLTVDFCRYPEVANDSDGPTLFMSELRKLAGEYARDGDQVFITAIVPVPGLTSSENYKPEDWIKNKLIDALVPSSMAGNDLFFDARPYITMTRGTNVKCLVEINADDGHLWTGQALARVKQVYDQGADGISIYQADGRIVGTMTTGDAFNERDFIANLGSTAAIDAMVSDVATKQNAYSTDIYMSYPSNYSGCRVKVWIEGGQPEEVQFYIDGKSVEGVKEPSWVIGLGGHPNNYAVTSKPAEFEVRAKIHGKWVVRKQSWRVLSGGP